MEALFLVNPDMVDVPIGTAGLVGVLGMVVVFIGLILLMFVIQIVGRIMQNKQAAATTAAAAPAAVSAPTAASPAKEAPGTAGKLKLHGIPDRDAALIMAITAHKTGKPLNILRFKSIKEVK